MTNTVRGTVTFEASDKMWTLKFSTNALCELEDELGEGAEQLAAIMARPGTGKIKMLRLILKCALSDNHPDLTLIQVGELIDEVGIEKAMGMMQKALTIGMPVAEKGKTKPENPQSGAQVQTVK